MHATVYSLLDCANMSPNAVKLSLLNEKKQTLKIDKTRK